MTYQNARVALRPAIKAGQQSTQMAETRYRRTVAACQSRVHPSLTLMASCPEMQTPAYAETTALSVAGVGQLMTHSNGNQTI